MSMSLSLGFLLDFGLNHLEDREVVRCSLTGNSEVLKGFHGYEVFAQFQM